MMLNQYTLKNMAGVIALAVGTSLLPQTQANERLFAYTYEPETMPKGAFHAAGQGCEE